MSSAATSSTKVQGSKIKGGGRAVLSSESRRALIELLLSLEDDKIPNSSIDNNSGNPDDRDDEDNRNKHVPYDQLSKHDKKRREKKFLKQLVKRHEMLRLQRKFNAPSDPGRKELDSDKQQSANADGNVVSDPLRTPALSSRQTHDHVNPNVRIELVEAIFPTSRDDAKKKNKSKDKEKGSEDDAKKTSKQKSKSSTSREEFKTGTRKIMVVPRNTSISDLKKQAQSKLKLKKKPIRVFLQPSSSNTSLLLDLDRDLMGLDDGTAVYISVTPASADGGDDERTKDGNKTKKKGKADVDDEEKSEDEEESNQLLEMMVDPLDSVKQAYRQRQRYLERSGNTNSKKHPQIDPIIDHKLRQLHEESRSKLPVAAHRQHIVEVIESNPVVILSSATGSGKSTQVPQFLLDRQLELQQHHKQQQQQQQQKSKESESSNHNLVNNNPNQRPYIVVTQPRKVAAISLANRVAEERGSPPPGSRGSSVGYMVRLDRRVDLRSCRIIYMTIGILLRMLLVQSSLSSSAGDVAGNEDDDSLDGGDGKKEFVPPLSLDSISALIIDEVHERDVNTDFTITVLKGLLSSKSHSHQDMPRLILMSASASTELFVDYFQSANNNSSPAIIEVPGKTYPVTSYWLSDCEKYCGKTMHSPPEVVAGKTEPPNSKDDPGNGNVELSLRAMDFIDNKFIRSLIAKIVDDQRLNLLPSSTDKALSSSGAILVFLPGLAEIDALSRCLNEEGMVSGDKNICTIMKLHSSTPRSDQEKVFRPAGRGRVKIVLATNIAETSVTIPDVRHVIDTCRVKESRYNSSTRIKELVTVWTSQASLTQRAGRAGRTSEGFCWRLCSEEFAKQQLLPQTPPEMVRTPLDELILQICLFYEQRRDDFYKSRDTTKNSDAGGRAPQFATGVRPMKFLSQTPTPPNESSLIRACRHLIEVDALKVVDNGSTEDEMGWLYRLTPLGYHLSRLPMDAKVGKILIIGCILGCLDGALTIAAALSCQKSCFVPSTSFRPLDPSLIEARNSLVEFGFGGRDWSGGTVKGDLIAVIAVYRRWKKHHPRQRGKFCAEHGLDNFVLQEIDRLREQYLDLIIDAGLASRSSSSGEESLDDCNIASEDALITSCCLVAGLYPNICTLARPTGPRRGGPSGGKLLTSDGDECRPSSSSFQHKRVRDASEKGKDAYAVYHAKHRTLGAVKHRAPGIFLSEVNFVSKFALLLFGGELELIKNAIIVDGWLKFKISDEGESKGKTEVDNAVLILSLRSLMEDAMNEHVVESCSSSEVRVRMIKRHQKIIEVVRKILADS